MEFIDLPLAGLKLIRAKIFEDDRGYFTERFKSSLFEDNGIKTPFVQDNFSQSKPGVLRGLHYQHTPAQGKLVTVVKGRIWDVAVDIRKDSPSFGQAYGLELSSDTPQWFWMPAGFAHGFCVLGDQPADVWYKTNAFYNQTGEGGILWNDPELKIEWPLASPVLSDRDQELISFSEYANDPKF